MLPQTASAAETTAESSQSLSGMIMSMRHNLNINTSSYGYLLKLDQKLRIENWMDDMPHDCNFIDASTAREATLEVYKDWLNWSKYSALAWLHRLDRYERRFRTAGVKYHRIPHTLRTTATLLHGSKIDQPVLRRLSQIFEPELARELQFFFNPWMEIHQTAKKIVEEINSYQLELEHLDFLRSAIHKFAISLAKLEKPLRHLRLELDWVEVTVSMVARRSDCRDSDGSKALAAPHSREGSLFRQWIHTFQDIESGYAKSKSSQVESYVASILDVGVKRKQYWSMLVEKSVRNEDSAA